MALCLCCRLSDQIARAPTRTSTTTGTTTPIAISSPVETLEGTVIVTVAAGTGATDERATDERAADAEDALMVFEAFGDSEAEEVVLVV